METSHPILLAGLVALVLSTPGGARAQQQVVPTPPPPSSMERPVSDLSASATHALAVAPAQPQAVPSRPGPPSVTPPAAEPASAQCPAALAAQCQAARLAEISYARQYYESLAEDLTLRRRAFEWHAFSTKALFWSVIAITAMGLILSWREFGKYYARSASAAGPQPNGENPPQSVFKVGAQGLEVTSSLIGFLVLTVSLAFFYLYVVNVYPLSELAPVQDKAAEVAHSSL